MSVALRRFFHQYLCATGENQPYKKREATPYNYYGFPVHGWTHGGTDSMKKSYTMEERLPEFILSVKRWDPENQIGLHVAQLSSSYLAGIATFQNE